MRFVRTPEQTEKDHQAAGMRPMTYRAIGEKFGVNESSAYQMVQRAIADIPRESTEELIQLELMKLDRIESKAADIMEKYHPFVSQKGEVFNVEDEMPVIQAMNTLLKIADRRARLLGLNAPTRTELTSTVSVTVEDRSAQAKRVVLAVLNRLHDE
jgi:hypothetical protein